MDVPTPQQCQPNIRVKEIQGVHRSVRSLGPPSGPDTIRGNLILRERGRLPWTRVTLTPKRISSRMDRPCAAACSLSLRYKEAGISTVVRTACSFMDGLSHKCLNMELPAFWARCTLVAQPWPMRAIDSRLHTSCTMVAEPAPAQEYSHPGESVIPNARWGIRAIC